MHRWLAPLAAVCLTASPASAQSTKPPPDFELWPEVDVYYRINDELRTLVQVSPTFMTTQQLSELSVSAYLDWSVRPLFRNAFTNDETKERLLSMRFGAEYVQTLDPGTSSSQKTLMLRGDTQGRFHLPVDLLLSVRTRLEGRRRFEGSPEFAFRLRERVQLEREFKVAGLALTPYVNGELFWSTPNEFTQLRLQGGVTLDLKLFARGQAVELYYLRLVDLRAGKPDSNVLGLVLHFYF